DEQVGPGLTGDGDAAVQTDVDVGVPRQPHPVTAGTLQLLLQGARRGEGDLALPGLLPLRPGVAPPVAGVDVDQRALRRTRRARFAAGADRRPAGRLQIDDVAVMIDAVARGQQEAALDLRARGQI